MAIQLHSRLLAFLKSSLAGYRHDLQYSAEQLEALPPILSEENSPGMTGFVFSTRKKWTILSVIYIVQISMNFNASVYNNAVPGMMAEFGISESTALIGQWIFLIAYAFGSELWAPWSEEFGRWPVLQGSLLFVNLFQIPCACSTNITTVIVARCLGGLSSAGGSVTLGMVADMWNAEDQQYAVAFIVFSSVAGSVVGPIVGGFVEEYLNWRWVFWIQLIFGVAVQLIHIFVPETRSSVLLDREARKLRNQYALDVKSTSQAEARKMTFRHVFGIWMRPFHMFLFEPIVLLLSLLSGFSDALIFTFLTAYGPVYRQWGFTTIQLGLAFIPIGIGYIISYLSFLPFIRHDNNIRATGTPATLARLTPERRLYWLLYTAPLLPLGLLGFSWSSLGPDAGVPWIVPMLFSVLVGIANYAIYMATVDYMIASYGTYSASATGGNALARDLLAGVSALYVRPLFQNLPAPYTLELPTTILACLAALFTIPIYVFFNNGPRVRAHSKFATEIAKARGEVITPREGKLSDLVASGFPVLLRRRTTDDRPKRAFVVESELPVRPSTATSPSTRKASGSGTWNKAEIPMSSSFTSEASTLGAGNMAWIPISSPSTGEASTSGASNTPGIPIPSPTEASTSGAGNTAGIPIPYLIAGCAL